MSDTTMLPSTSWVPKRIKVPRRDGALLASMERDEAVDAVWTGHDHLARAPLQILGRPLRELRSWTRKVAIQEAVAYVSKLLDRKVTVPSLETLTVTGHQPEIYHPGVWAKNFAAFRLSELCDGVALNLVVDNDTLDATDIRVPVGERSQPRIERVAFDQPSSTPLWECAEIGHRERFRSFADRVRDTMACWGMDSIISEFWSGAVDGSSRLSRLADCLTAARVRLEHTWGIHNLELPISRLCQSEPFYWFVLNILTDAERFCAIHNQILGEYRQVYKIRSHTHPVPELDCASSNLRDSASRRRDARNVSSHVACGGKQSGDWIEVPLWVWREGDERRERLYLRKHHGRIELSDGTACFAHLPNQGAHDTERAIDTLKQLAQQGIHLRTRALTTTLFARLFLADFFIHGIGGAKYDEMTDRIIAQFYGIAPPPFLTLSATLHLPFAEPYDISLRDEQRLRLMLRDLKYNPQRHMPPEERERFAEQISEKEHLIAEQQQAKTCRCSRRERRLRSRENYARFRRFREINQELAQGTAAYRHRLESELDEVRQQLRANAILQDREFAFCLFPEDKLRPFMTRIWTSKRR